ncbi:STN domain-containing protein [Bradyrhizobium cenepequi]
MLTFNQNRQQSAYRPRSWVSAAVRAATMLQQADIAYRHRSLRPICARAIGRRGSIPPTELNRRLLQWMMASLAFAALTVAAASPVHSQTSPQPGTAGAAIYFDMPAQPLGAALSRYGDTTRREVIYAMGYVEGKTSGEVRGLFTANEALLKLLAGTRLSAQVLSETAFVLVPQPPRPIAKLSDLSAIHRRYYALLQATLLDALCEPMAAPAGNYRILVIFWVNMSGVIYRFERIGSAGDGNVDEQIDAVLRSTRVPEAPPIDFAQPVLIKLAPRAGTRENCSTLRTAGNSPGAAQR